MRNSAVRSSKSRRPRWFWSLVAAGLLMLVTIAVVAMSYLLWQRHVEAVGQQQNYSRELTKTTFADDDLSVEKLETYARDLRETSHLCEHGVFEGYYRQMVKSAEASHQDCLRHAAKVTDLAETTERVSRYLRDSAVLSKSLEETQADLKKLKPNQYKHARETWQKANGIIGDIEVSELFRAVRDKVTSAIRGIIKSYQALEKADAAKKRVDFDNALVELGNAYDKLFKIDAIDKSELETLLRQAQAL